MTKLEEALERITKLEAQIEAMRIVFYTPQQFWPVTPVFIPAIPKDPLSPPWIATC